jgi:hypothetical protein
MEPCEASELVHFRKRIGESGIELILKESIRINGNDSMKLQRILPCFIPFLQPARKMKSIP